MSKNLKSNFIVLDGVKYLEYDIYSQYKEDMLAIFSTRQGGISTGNYESMNLGFNTEDSYDTVFENFKIFCSTIGIYYRNLVFSYQKHNDNIKRVYESDKGKGIVKSTDYDDVDGLITNVPQMVLVTFHADCTPIYYYDKKNKAIGLAHSGWRGTSKEIAVKMIYEMKENFNSDPENLVTVIGPSICKKCYEVDDDVLGKFNNMSIDTSEYIKFDKNKKKYLLDIWGLNKKLLFCNGVKKENIFISGLCTMENKDMFFSHRGHKGKRGNMAAMIMLK